ncbi:gap junction delta-4 protein-like [Brienomyrus brachyistius]|uniref:gap junction delta-4 protein-like n=1 Tax=Brienomyrus brachyistius TaxID=42636 RepID=UPI0020B1EF2B|nr:gap junction delta-4 protein-like [Brienomyrus brachyistius]
MGWFVALRGFNKMEKPSVIELVFVTLIGSVTVTGKLWLVLMVLLRVLVLLFAGYPLYIDEQYQFSCNTIQPGCAGVCYDTYCPVSVLRFWVVQLTALCLPGAAFVVYVVHVVVSERSARASSASSADAVRVRGFTAVYLFHLLLSTLLEAAFGVAQGFLFGFHVPRRVLCYELPCTTTVDCYVSRATEKTILLRFMQAVGAVSFLLNVVDLVCTTKLLATQKMKRKRVALMRLYKEEQSYVSAGGEELDVHLPLTLEMEGSPAFSRAKVNESGLAEGPIMQPEGMDPSPLPGNQQCGTAQPRVREDEVEQTGSEACLCPAAPTSTRHPLKVSKRSRFRPPPPPRRDSLARAFGPKGVGHHTLVEVAPDLQTSGPEMLEKKSAWV